jgi:hypothetical protein
MLWLAATAGAAVSAAACPGIARGSVCPLTFDRYWLSRPMAVGKVSLRFCCDGYDFCHAVIKQVFVTVLWVEVMASNMPLLLIYH